MPSRLLDLSDRMYAFLLWVYPRPFRERFAAEMAQVFRSLCREAYAQSGVWGVIGLWLPALWDEAQGALYQWWQRLFQRRVGNMETNLVHSEDGIQPLSPIQAGIAALPFLAFGVSNIVSRLFLVYDVKLPNPQWWQALLFNPFLVFNWLVLIGLGVCLLMRFPRWGYAYLGWALLFAWWWMSMQLFGVPVGWRIWLPLLAVLLIPLAIRGSWQPYQALLSGIYKDWTLLSLAVYILYAFVFMIFDENHHPYLLAFIAASALFLSLGAWGYFRAKAPFRRILALLGGLLAATAIYMLNYATWDYRAYYNLPENTGDGNRGALYSAAVLILFMFGNALLAHWWLKRSARLKRT